MLKTMTFNILMGGGDDARFNAALAIISRASPDILILQECVGWESDDSRLRRVAAALDLPAAAPHAHLGLSTPRGSGRRFNVAAFSRLPMKSMTVHNDGKRLAHCAVDFTVDWDGLAIRILGTHLVARREESRFAEAQYLLHEVLAADALDRPLLLLGDLNALSRRDPYPRDLGDLLARAQIDKYEVPPRFDTIEAIERRGFVDTLYHREAPSDWITAPRDRGGVHIDYRTDYIFASPVLADRVHDTAVIPLRNDESDHFPVVAALR